MPTVSLVIRPGSSCSDKEDGSVDPDQLDAMFRELFRKSDEFRAGVVSVHSLNMYITTKGACSLKCCVKDFSVDNFALMDRLFLFL